MLIQIHLLVLNKIIRYECKYFEISISSRMKFGGHEVYYNRMYLKLK